MATIGVRHDMDIPGDGSVEVTFIISNISPQNEKRANAMLTQLDSILADGRVDTFEIFTTLGLIAALRKL